MIWRRLPCRCGVALALALAVVPWATAGARSLEVFAGSASKPAIQEVAGGFTARTGIEVRLHLGGSGAMLSQMQLSERGDVYFPGSSDFLDRAARLGLVEPDNEFRVAYVPQDLALFPHLSVRENLLFGLRASGRLPPGSGQRLDHWVGLLDLHGVVDRNGVHTLSGGERQRVALAGELITEPRVVFLDEPFSALDVALRRRLQVEFRELRQRSGVTVIQVTHDPEETFRMADRMAILMNGRIAQTGTPSALYNRPANLSVARFLMLQNLYPGRVREGESGHRTVDLSDGGMQLAVATDDRFPPGSHVVVGIRPEEVILLLSPRPAGAGIPQQNCMQAEVTGWVDLGHYRLVRLRAGGVELDSWLNIRAAREHPMEPGTHLRFHIRPDSLCLLPPEG